MSEENNLQHIILGQSVDRDGAIGAPAGVPISEIDRHLLVAGVTGTGKSVTGIHATLTAHEATDGAVITIDPKGDFSEQLARSKHARSGTINDVLYFDVAEYLPRIGFFDIRADVAAGRNRGQVVRTIADHFLSIVEQLLPADAEAIRAPDVLKYLIIALFDPIDGQDAYGLDELVDAVYELRHNRTVPSVSVTWSEQLLDSITDGNASMFDGITQGAVTRVEKLYGSGYLRPMFTTVPDAPNDGFRFDEYLQQNQLIIFDLGGLPTKGTQAVANTLLSLLWRALQRRHERLPAADRHQVVTLIDEVPQLGIEDRLSDLLALGRGYGLGMINMMQYPQQLAERSATDSAYHEVLSNSHSVLLGRIPHDPDLAESLASYSLSAPELKHRLTNLPMDRWLFQPATPRGESRQNPYMLADLPLPPGHPEAPPSAQHPNSDAFDEAFADRRAAIRDAYGVQPDSYTVESINEATVDSDFSEAIKSTLAETHYATTFPLLDGLPAGVAYTPERNMVRCTECNAYYPASFDGLLSALRCHGDLTRIDRDEIPPVALELPFTREEIAEKPASTRELVTLQVLQNATIGRYDRLEIDLVFDPLQTILERIGIRTPVIRSLEDKGYLTREKLHSHVYYTVTAEGRELIDAPHSHGVGWGHGKGDLTESMLHQALVSAVERYATERFVQDPDHSINEVIPYYEISEADREQYSLSRNTRFDVVGLSDDGDIDLIGEAELDNHDRATAPLQDYDQIAAVNPSTAIWAVSTSKRGHNAVIQPLSDPADDLDEIDDATARIPAYSSSTRIPDISGIDTDGMTEIHTLNELRKELSEPELTSIST